MLNKISKTLKIIRKNKQMSLSETTHNICSISALSKFENGEADISVGKFLKILSRLDISLAEFSTYIDTSKKNNSFNDNLAINYNHQKVKQIRRIIQSCHKQYIKTHSKKEFLHYMMAISFYKDLTSKDLSSSNDKVKLYNLIFRSEEWTRLEIETFGNTMPLLSNQNIYHLTFELFKNLNSILASNQILYIDAWQTIFNAFQTLIFRESKLALKLDKKICNEKTSNRFIEINIEISFFHNLFLYSQKKSDNLKQEIQTTINFLRKNDCKILSNKFENALLSIE